MREINKTKYGHKYELYLVMILKDEEKSIEETILAFHDKGDGPIYDHLMVEIDDSTTDKTEEIVRKYTDDIKFFTWEENFAKHRNDLIDRIPIGVYTMFPDGHEVMRPNGINVLHKFLQDPPTEINAYAPYIEIDCDEYDIPDVVFPRPIFFKNTGKVKFHRGVHNHLLDGDDKPIRKFSYISFKHNMHPKRKKMRKEMRADMNVRKLLETTKTNPDDARDLFYLGDAYDERGDVKKALEYYEKAFKLTDKYDTDLAAQICICALNANNKIANYGDDATKWAFRGMRNRWDRAELYYFLGLLLSKNKKDEQAIHWYKIATTLRLPNSAYFLMGKVYSWFPYDGLMLSYNNIGDLENSLLSAKKILEWKKNKVTGEFCPIVMKNIKNIEEGIINAKRDEKARQIMADNQELIDEASGQVKKEKEKLLAEVKKVEEMEVV